MPGLQGKCPKIMIPEGPCPKVWETLGIEIHDSDVVNNLKTVMDTWPIFQDIQDDLLTEDSER